MKLTRSGHYKNNGSETLVSYDLHEPGGNWYLFRKAITWQRNPWCLFFRMKGPEGKATYDYDFQFTAHELVLLVQGALTGASKDVAIHAHAKAIGAFIEEVLDEKNKPAAT